MGCGADENGETSEIKKYSKIEKIPFDFFLDMDERTAHYYTSHYNDHVCEYANPEKSLRAGSKSQW